jgi:hypothetical protein
MLNSLLGDYDIIDRKAFSDTACRSDIHDSIRMESIDHRLQTDRRVDFADAALHGCNLNPVRLSDKKTAAGRSVQILRALQKIPESGKLLLLCRDDCKTRLIVHINNLREGILFYSILHYFRIKSKKKLV